MESMIKDRKNTFGEEGNVPRDTSSKVEEQNVTTQKGNVSFGSERVVNHVGNGAVGYSQYTLTPEDKKTQKISESKELPKAEGNNSNSAMPQNRDPSSILGQRQRVYSTPEAFSENVSLSGVASTAKYVSSTSEVVKGSSSQEGKGYVKAALSTHIKERLIKSSSTESNRPAAVSETEKTMARMDAAKSKKNSDGGGAGQFKPASEGKVYNDQIKRKQGQNKNVVYGIARNIYQQIDTAATQSAKSGDLSDRVRGQGTKYLVRTPRYIKNAAGILVVGPYRNVKFGAKLLKDMNVGALTGKEAGLLALKNGGLSLKNGAKGIVKAGMREVSDFHGSDDLGIQTVRKSKDTIVSTSRTLKVTSRALRAIKNAPKNIHKQFRRIQRLAKNSFHAVKYAGAFVKTGVKILANPVALKFIAILAAIILVILLLLSMVTSVAALIPSLTLVSDDVELTKTYVWVTELDTDLNYEIAQVPLQIENAGVDEYHYYLNGSSTSAENMVAYTNADQVLNYLNIKYDDYTLDGVLSLFGIMVRDEVKYIHEQLYSLTYNRWTEEIPHSGSGEDDEGWTEYVYHLDISLTSSSFEEYIEENKGILFDPGEEQRYVALNDLGGMTLRQELGSPFVGLEWRDFISSRYGYRIHPIELDKSFHTGIDIVILGGTPINAVMSGEVMQVSFEADGYGNYLVIEDEDRRTLYAHCQSISVARGDSVDKGDIVGFVGTTGQSTGDHLHIEFEKDGEPLNPAFYLSDK